MWVITARYTTVSKMASIIVYVMSRIIIPITSSAQNIFFFQSKFFCNLLSMPMQVHYASYQLCGCTNIMLAWAYLYTRSVLYAASQQHATTSPELRSIVIIPHRSRDPHRLCIDDQISQCVCTLLASSQSVV